MVSSPVSSSVEDAEHADQALVDVGGGELGPVVVEEQRGQALAQVAAGTGSTHLAGMPVGSVNPARAML